MLMEREESSPYALLRRLALHWRAAARVFAGCFLLTIALALLLPSKYAAHLKILVRNLPADSAVEDGKQTPDVSEAQVNTEIQLLTSADVLRKVVAAEHLGGAPGADAGRAEKRDEVALRHLEKDLSVAAIRNSNVIEATYQSKDPQRAAAVLRSLSQVYMQSSHALNESNGSYGVYAGLSARYAAELAEAEANLDTFRHAHDIVALPEQTTLALQNIAQLQARLDEAGGAVEKTVGSAGALKQELSALPATVERARRSIPNQASAEQLGALLLTLQNKRAETVLRYRPEDRTVRELDMQIAQTEAALDKANHTKTEEISTGANPAYDGAESQYVELIADQAGDRALARQTAAELRADQAKLASLDAQSSTYQDLVRRVDALRALDDSARKKLEDARSRQMLGGGATSDVSVVEAPFPPSVPDSPKRGLILAVGFVWSLLLGLATAIARDLWVERIHSPFALERATGMPLLAAVAGHVDVADYGRVFPAAYLAMQRKPALIEGRS